MRKVVALLAVFSLTGCYRVVRVHRKEKAVTTVGVREVRIPSHSSRYEVRPNELAIFVSREVECRKVADVDAQYEKVTELREMNWPKIPFFVGLGVGALVSGMGLLFSFGALETEGGKVAVGTGAGLAGVGSIFGLVHAIAPEDDKEVEVLPNIREERILDQKSACSVEPVADEAVELVTNGGRTLELRTDAEGKIALPLDRLAHTSLLEARVGALNLEFGGKQVRHPLELPDELLPSLARAASKTPNPIEEEPLVVGDRELVVRAEGSIARKDCTSAVLALEKASPRARENSVWLETYAAALKCAGRDPKAQRAYAALYRMKPSPKIELALANEPEESRGGLIAVMAPPENPLRTEVVAVFPIHFNLEKPISTSDRAGLFQLYTASLGEQGVRMVPPSELKRLLAKQKIDSFRECFDTNCQIELGKAMAASVALQTAVTPIGDTCVVSSTAFDLKTETSIRTAKRKTTCKIGKLGEALEAVAIDLATRGLEVTVHP